MVYLSRNRVSSRAAQASGSSFLPPAPAKPTAVKAPNTVQRRAPQAQGFRKNKMAQNNTVAIPVQRYTRADFTALRASLNRLPIARIAELYYSEDDLLALACDLRDTLVHVISQLSLDLFGLRDTAGFVVGELMRVHSDLLGNVVIVV